MSYHLAERIGRIPLSRHFSLRQFLYSEIAAAHNIPNVPDDIELAVVTATRLCQDILEPIVELFGPIIIRSGYRSTRLNAFGCEHRLRCASNKRNRAYHIWDQRDHNGHIGAATCIVIPEAAERYRADQIDELAAVLHRHLPYHRMTFFRQHACLNIGWHEAPRREILHYCPKPRWILRDGQEP